jgi:glucose/arabinose dehydrogenase
MDWNDPTAQWAPFMWNFVRGSMWMPFINNYIGRPTGIAVGSRGSLFVADDSNGVIYRIRPVAAR